MYVFPVSGVIKALLAWERMLNWNILDCKYAVYIFKVFFLLQMISISNEVFMKNILYLFSICFNMLNLVNSLQNQGKHFLNGSIAQWQQNEYIDSKASENDKLISNWVLQKSSRSVPFQSEWC